MDQSFHGSPLTPRVLRIVVVEDNLDSVHTTALLLRELGHTVNYPPTGSWLQTSSGDSARFRPCDLGLPGSNGFDVCAQVKADPELRGVRVLALTAYSDEKSRQRAREAGFDGYYAKPLLPAALADLFGDPRTGQLPKSEPHSP